MRQRIALIFALALAASTSGAAGIARAEVDEASAQAACQDDAFRFCQATIPDRERTLACLIYYKDSISAACRTVLAGVIPPDPPARKKGNSKPRKPGGPIDLSPTARR
jgi:hypothetical protein